MKPKAVLFDVDGTLMPFDGIIKHLQDTCRHFGLRVLTKKEIINGVIGLTIHEAVGKFSLDMSGVSKGDVVKYYRDTYIRDIKGMKPFPNAVRVLRWLKTSGFKIGIVTTKSRIQATKMLDYYKMPYDVLVAQEDAKKRKPDPEPTIKACKELRLRPSECLFVGDHPFDMQSAASAGCIPVGTLTGWGNRKNLKSSGARYLIEDLGGLKKIIQGDNL